MTERWARLDSNQRPSVFKLYSSSAMILRLFRAFVNYAILG